MRLKSCWHRICLPRKCRQRHRSRQPYSRHRKRHLLVQLRCRSLRCRCHIPVWDADAIPAHVLHASAAGGAENNQNKQPCHAGAGQQDGAANARAGGQSGFADVRTGGRVSRNRKDAPAGKGYFELYKGLSCGAGPIGRDRADLYVNGKCIAKGDIVVVDDNFGIRIAEIIEPLELEDLSK